MTPSTVYGSLMHHRDELTSLGEAAYLPPYNAPPKAPVLYIKPANTYNAFGGTLHLPAAQSQIQARACLGLIYRPNRQIVLVKTALTAIKKVVKQDWEMALLCDFSLPQSSFYRPPLRFNSLDGSLALPQSWLHCSDFDLQDQRIETWVNGQCMHAYSTANWLQSATAQLETVSEFIAWEDGDVLMLGCPPDATLVNAGDTVETRWASQVFTRTLIATQEQP